MKNSDLPHDHKIYNKISVSPTFEVKLNADGGAEVIGKAEMATYHHQQTKSVEMDRLAKLWEAYKELQ